MQALKEVTQWNVSYRQPNHTYLVDGDRIIAYLKWHAGEPIFSPARMRMDKRYRKFVAGNMDVFNVQSDAVSSDLTTVAGSKPGITYTVNLRNKTCTCEGFKWRSKCRHLELVG